MAEKKTGPCDPSKTLENVVSAKMGLAEKEITPTEDQKPWNTTGKTTFCDIGDSTSRNLTKPVVY